MIFLHIGDVKHVMLSVVKLATKDLDLSTDEEEVSFMLFEIKFSSNNNPPPSYTPSDILRPLIWKFISIRDLMK